MMYKLLSAAAVVGIASADQFRFMPNNDVNNGANWEGGVVPTGTLNFNSPCGAGPTSFSINADMTVGAFEFPDTGEVIIGDNVEISFGTGPTEDGSWRCKSGSEMDAGCSTNYETLANGTWVPALSAPGFGDSVEFSSDNSFTFYTRGDFYSEIVLTGSNPQTFSSTLGSFTDFWNENPYMWLGEPPVLGSSTTLCGGSLVACQSLNTDSCNAMELEAAIDDPASFWDLNEQERTDIIADAEAELDRIINLRQGIVNDFHENQQSFIRSANDLQDNFESSGSGSGMGPVGASTIESLKVTSDEMVAWMEQTAVGTASGLHALKHDLTVAETQLTWDWYANPNVTLDAALWDEIDDENSLTTTDPLAVVGATTNANGRARRQYPLPPGATMTAQQVTDFVLIRANAMLNDISASRGQSWTVTAVYWGGAVPESESANFAAAAGAFQFIGMDISGAPTMQVDGETVPAIAPEILEGVFASIMLQMSLYARENHLRTLLYNQPTIAPQASTGDESDIMDIIPYIAAGAAVLLICLIVAVVMISGGNKEETPKNDRSVVSFENPMYDDPAAVPAGDANDGGLYDEPTFNEGNKDNPTYASNEDTAESGGYLDVEPDDGEDEEDEEDEDEEDDDDEDEDE